MNLRAAVFIAAVLFVGCSQEQKQTGPGVIYYGEDICERCKMIISEKDFTAQYVFKDGTDKIFDDIGCMMIYYSQSENNKESIAGIYVRDIGTGKWINGENAYYFWSENMKTPMGHGIFALANNEDIKNHSILDKSDSLGQFRDTVKWIEREEIFN